MSVQKLEEQEKLACPKCENEYSYYEWQTNNWICPNEDCDQKVQIPEPEILVAKSPEKSKKEPEVELDFIGKSKMIEGSSDEGTISGKVLGLRSAIQKELVPFGIALGELADGIVTLPNVFQLRKEAVRENIGLKLLLIEAFERIEKLEKATMKETSTFGFSNVRLRHFFPSKQEMQKQLES